MLRFRPVFAACLATVLAGCRAEPPRIASFTATPNRLQVGQASVLAWSVSGATRLVLEDPSGAVDEGLDLPDGRRELHPTESGVWVLTAWRDKVSASATVSLSVSAAPRVVSFVANPTVVAPGGKATLSWVTEGAAAVTVSDGTANLSVEPTLTSGQVDVFPTATTVYTLSAQGGGGLSATRDATVEVPTAPQIVSFNAAPTSVNPNQPLTLTWSVAATNEISIKKGSTGGALSLGSLAQAAQGTYVVRPDRSEKYTLTAMGAGGTSTAEVSVAVQPVITGFDATPPGADPADPYTLGWTTHSAERLRVLKGSTQVLLDTTDLATCDSGTLDEPAPGAVASVAYELEITSREGAKISRFLTVGVGAKPQVLAFSVTPANVTVGKGFTVAWKTSGAASIVIKLDGTTATTLTSAARLADGTWDSPAQTTPGPVQVTFLARSAALSQEARAATVSVYPPPQVTGFSASPATVAAAGDPSTLAWTTSGATSAEVRAGAVAVGPAAVPSGNSVVRPLTSGTYTLRAHNPAGDFADRTVDVAVQAPAAALTVSPSPFVPGEELTVSWNVTASGTTAPRLAPAPYSLMADALGDISTTGTTLAFATGDEALAVLDFPTGFSFDLGPAQSPATQAVVSTNGFLTFDMAWADPAPTNLACDDPAAPPLLVAPLWDDLALTAPEVRWQLLDADTLAIQWTAAQFRTGTSGAGGSATFQALLHRDGTVDLRYGALSGPAGDAAKAQGSSATVALGGPRGSWCSQLTMNASRLSGVATAHFASGPVALSGTGKLRPRRSVEVGLVVSDATGDPLVAVARANALAIGAVGVNEVLPVPAVGVDPSLGEWLELRNTSASAADLSSVVLTAGSGSLTLPTGTTVAPGALLLLGHSADTGQNGNVPVQVAWGSALDLPDTGGSVALSLRGQPLGSLVWTTAPPAGTSIRRDEGATFDPGAPASATTCLDPTPTPGALNGGCVFDVVPNVNAVLDISATGQDVTPAGNTSGDWRVQVDFTALAGTGPAFAFPYFGTSFGKAEVSSNGWLALYNGASSGSTSSGSTPKPLPTPGAPNAVLAPFWDDLSTSKTGASSPPAKLFVELSDPDGNPATADRILVVEWSHFDLPATTVDADLTFEVLLYEATGDVEFRWGALDAGEAGDRALGSAASVGLEDPTGLVGFPQVTPLSPSTGLRFTRP